jgi:hypothetical protein
MVISAAKGILPVMAIGFAFWSLLEDGWQPALLGLGSNLLLMVVAILGAALFLRYRRTLRQVPVGIQK